MRAIDDRARRMARALLGMLLAAFLASCMSVPLAETGAMVKAVDAVKTAGDVLIGELNAAEKQAHLLAAKPSPNDFEPRDAVYYSTLDTVAPRTARFKAAIEILKSYADLINGLVQGTGTDAAQEQLQSIWKNLSTVLGLPGTQSVIATLSPLIKRALLAQSQAEARALVLEGAPAIHNLIGALRDATPAMFEILVASSYKPGEVFGSANEKLRVEISNYVILFDRLQETFDRLADAFAKPGNAMSLATLAAATGELIADAKIVAQVFAKK